MPMKKDDLSPEGRAAWINLPHARTVAERIERQLELLRVLEGSGARHMNATLAELRHALEPWLEDAPPETAAASADPILAIARELVTGDVMAGTPRVEAVRQLLLAAA